MINKTKKTVFIVLLLNMFSIAFLFGVDYTISELSIEEREMANDVYLQIECNKEKIGLFSSFVIVYKFINASNRDISFLPNIISRDTALNFYNGDELLYPIYYAKGERNIIPKLNSFIILRSGEKFECSITYSSNYGFYGEYGRLKFGRTLRCKQTDIVIPVSKLNEVTIIGEYYLLDTEEAVLIENNLPLSTANPLESNSIILKL